MSLDEGYVGISKRPEARFNQHKNSDQNIHLKRAIAKYDDIELVILVKSTKQYIRELELSLRPDENIGWNRQRGGMLPPVKYGDDNNKCTEEAREAMRGDKNMMRDPEIAAKLSGKNNYRYDHTLYHWIHKNGEERFSTKQDMYLLTKSKHVYVLNQHGRKSTKGWKLIKE